MTTQQTERAEALHSVTQRSGRVNRPRNARTGMVEPLPFESIPSTAFPNSVASISATVRLSASTGSMVIKLLLCGPPGEKSAARLGVNVVFLAPRGYRRRVSARLDLCSQRVALGGGELGLGQVDSKRRRRPRRLVRQDDGGHGDHAGCDHERVGEFERPRARRMGLSSHLNCPGVTMLCDGGKWSFASAQ
jgi:hypothetical protein